MGCRKDVVKSGRFRLEKRGFEPIFRQSRQILTLVGPTATAAFDPTVKLRLLRMIPQDSDVAVRTHDSAVVRARTFSFVR